MLTRLGGSGSQQRIPVNTSIKLAVTLLCVGFSNSCRLCQWGKVGRLGGGKADGVEVATQPTGGRGREERRSAASQLPQRVNIAAAAAAAAQLLLLTVPYGSFSIDPTFRPKFDYVQWLTFAYLLFYWPFCCWPVGLLLDKMVT